MPNDTDRYLTLAEAAVKGAVDAGASHAEAAAGRSRDIAVEVERSSIRSAESGHGESLSIRAFVDGAAASLSIEGLQQTDARAAGAECARMAAAATPDPDFHDLAHPDPCDEIEGLYDEAVAAFGVAEAVRAAVANVDEAKKVADVVVVQGDVGVEESVGALANSNGVSLVSRATSLHLAFFAILRDGDDVGSYHDFDLGRRLDDVSLTGLGRRVAEQARRFLGGRQIDTARRDLILGPLAAYGFLQSILAAANAESVQRGRSFMAGREGTRIAAEALTLIDDPLIPRGIRSGAHDGEGVRRRRTTVIDCGVLTTYLHNTYTANKAGCRPTGHGTQGGGIAATNLQVALGDRPADDLIAETKDGIYVNPGAITPNMTSGDVSSSIDFGYRIDDGRLVHPVVTCLVGGTVWELLDHIDAVSSDCREEPGNVLPTIRIRDILVAGGG